MRAVVLRAFGEPEVLQIEELPIPEPGPGEVLIRVKAVCVATTKDIATRVGRSASFRPIHQVPSHSGCGSRR